MRITHPRPQAGHQHDLGIDFTDGVADVDQLHPERELALIQHGYGIQAEPEVEAPYHGGLGEAIVDLTSLSKAELLDIAETESVEVPSKATKAQLIEILSAQPASPIPGATQNDDGSWTIEAADELAEDGRRLASEREDLIAAGADPADLEIPLHPMAED